MSKKNDFQEELDVLSWVKSEQETLQNEVASHEERMISLSSELKEFNHQRNINGTQLQTLNLLSFFQQVNQTGMIL